MFGAKVQIAAHEKALAFEPVMAPFDRDKGYSPMHPEVLRANPKRQVPVLIDGDLALVALERPIPDFLSHLKPAI
jgi:glutathione S-transferase